MTQLRPRPAKCVKELPHALETEIGFAALNCSDVGTIDIGAMRKGLLRQLKILAPLS